jgi:hypothetical protein
MSITQKEADQLRCLIHKMRESHRRELEAIDEHQKDEEDLRLYIEELKELKKSKAE